MRKHLPWILFMLCLLLLLTGGVVTATRWISGDRLHKFIEQKSSEALSATTSFGPLRWGWFELFSPHFHAKGVGTGALRQVEAGGIHGRLSPRALLQGLWRIKEITLDWASVHLGSSLGSKGASKTIKIKPAPPASLLPAWIPTLLVIDVIRVGKADVFIELPSGKSLDILGSRLEAYQEASETRIVGHGGILKTGFLPALNIGTMRCLIQEKGVKLTKADLFFPEAGKIVLEGSFPETQQSLLKGVWDKVPFSTFFPSLKKQLVGSFDGKATVQWDANGLVSAEGKTQAPNVILTEIPMMNEVATLTRMDAFHHLLLQQAQASFSLKGGVTSYRNVLLESKNLIKLIGQADTQPDGSFAGSFQLGLSSPIVKAIPGAYLVFSKDQQDGYFWTPLSVGGNLAHLTEDLTPRIKAAIFSNAGLLFQQGLKQGLKIFGAPDSSRNQHSNPPSSTPAPDDPAKAPPDILGGF